jgi:hypothetical protein
MSYSTVLDGLHARLAVVNGIALILKYEPTSVQAFPTLYSLLDTVERSQQGQLTIMRYTVLHRLLFRWTDNAQAEVELIPYVNSVPAVIDADPTLGGVLGTGTTSGYARVTSINAVFVVIGQTLYRALDVRSEVIEKAPVRSGI